MERAELGVPEAVAHMITENNSRIVHRLRKQRAIVMKTTIKSAEAKDVAEEVAATNAIPITLMNNSSNHAVKIREPKIRITNA